MTINLAFCITELRIGGAERALCELAIRLDRTRFQVTVYSLQDEPGESEPSCVPLLREAGIPVRFLGVKNFGSALTGYRRLKRMLTRQKPEIFLSFLFHANVLGRLAARSAGVPHILSGIRVAERQKRWHLLLDRWTSRGVETYVCVSQSVADFTVREGRIPPKKILVIPNGIEPCSIDPSISRKNRMIYVGRIEYQKGLDWLFETVPQGLPKRPDWELWIVGDGERRKELTDFWLSESFDSVRNRVKLLGWREDIHDLLTASKLFILPSRWEGMPNVLLQAMAAGLPIVSTRAEGVVELLGPIADKQTCAFGDSEALSERILALTTPSGPAEDLGRQNRLRVETEFGLPSMVRQYENLFLRLVSGHESSQEELSF